MHKSPINGEWQTQDNFKNASQHIPHQERFTLPVAEPKSSTVKGFVVIGAIENPYKVVGDVGFVLMEVILIASPTSLLTQFCHSF